MNIPSEAEIDVFKTAWREADTRLGNGAVRAGLAAVDKFRIDWPEAYERSVEMISSGHAERVRRALTTVGRKRVSELRPGDFETFFKALDGPTVGEVDHELRQLRNRLPGATDELLARRAAHIFDPTPEF